MTFGAALVIRVLGHNKDPAMFKRFIIGFAVSHMRGIAIKN